jgi:predicted DNA-binding transcriptional regulator YafY
MNENSVPPPPAGKVGPRIGKPAASRRAGHPDYEPGGQLEELKRLARLLHLLDLIGNAPRRWHRKALSARLEVSERQIDKDLQLLRHGLLCAIARSRDGYYIERMPVLPPVHYTAAEGLALISALTFARDSGALDDVSLAAAIARTENALPDSFLPLIAALRRHAGASTPRRHHRAAMLTMMQSALNERRCVRATYETASRGGAIGERVLQPYHLEARAQGWLLVAHDSRSGELRDFMIDRIVTAELLDERYEIPADFDLAAYRGSGWGLLRGASGPPEQIVLRMSADEARRLRDDDHHASQHEERQVDGTWLITFHAGVNAELVRWVFRWGAGCEVLEPPELRAMVVAMARAVAERNYDGR